MGIDQERFVEVNPELVCCICTNVLEDPIESPCRHVFCTECITRWLDMRANCPTCRQPLRNYQMKPALPLLRNIIAKLRIRCDFIEEGCTGIVDYEQLGSHLRSCPYGPMTCENEGCEVTFPRKNKCQHEAECPFRRVVCSAFSNHGCGMEYKLSEAANHNCVESLKSLVRDLGGKVATLEQTVNELRQSMQEMKDAQSRNNHVQDTGSARNSASTGRAGHQDGDSGLISLLSEDEEESNDQPWLPIRTHLLQDIIAESSTNTFANLLVRNLQSEGILGRQTDHNQLQLDRERRPSRALRQSSPTQRRRSRSRSPSGRRNRESSPIESGTRRRRSRMSASSTCTQTSSSGSNTQESSNSPVVHPRRRRTIRPISVDDDNSSQMHITGNSTSSSDESDQQNATEASDGNVTSPHWSLDHSPAYSSSDDSHLFADSDDWWRNLINTYSNSASFTSDGSCITATFH